MSTFQLTLVKEQIDEAVSGAYRALRDPWGYTGNSKVIGDTFGSFVHMGSGAVADFFTVSGDQTGHGILANKLFTDLKDLSVTGNTYLPSITGYANANHITTETGYFPYITGDLVKHGNTSFTGALFNFTGDDVSFKLNNAKNFTIELASGEGGDILLTGYDELAFRGDSVIFDNKLNGHTILGEVKHTEGTFNVTENAYFSGEIYQSGVQLDVRQVNSVVLTGSVMSAFLAKGDLLVGSGALQSTVLPLGTHGQLLQVDTSAGGGDHGMKWVDSGIFAGAGGGVGSGISGHRSVVSVNNFVTLAPDEQFAVPATDLSMGIQTKGAGGLYATDDTLKAIGSLGNGAVDFQLLTSSNSQIAGGRYSTIAGGRNNSIHASSSGAFVVGVDNDAAFGDYTFIGGAANKTSGNGVVMIGMGNKWEDVDDNAFPTENYSIILGSGNNSNYPVGAGASEAAVRATIIKNVQIGHNNTISGASNVIQIGESNAFYTGYAGGQKSNAILIGKTNQSDSTKGFLVGYSNSASTNAQGCTVIGEDGFADRWGEFVWSLGSSYQAPSFLLKGQTTDATVTEIFLGGASNKRITIPTDTSITLHCIVSARKDSAGESAAYEVSLFAKNDAGTITVTQDTLNVIHEDDATWTIAWSADTPNLSAVLKVTGAASKTIDWVARVDAIEITN